jgi:anti-sigma factor RsiW
MRCEEARLLLQAELDNELDAGRSADLAMHAGDCGDCARLRQELAALSRQVKAAPYHAAPERLRAKLEAKLAPPAAKARWRWREIGTAAGFALAACLALFVLLPRGSDELTAQLVAGHLRSLQAEHLLDVRSSDQHQVKPWFLGRLDYAPPVEEVPGFPLEGGRLDYIGGRPVAALVYRSGHHVINLYVFSDQAAAGARVAQRDGFNLRRWQEGGMVFWAVSDANPDALAAFERAWRAAR